MRNLLSLLALVVIGVGIAGYYLDWYHVRSTRSSVAGHQSVNVDINGGKILHDVEKGVHKGEEKLQSVLDKNHQEAASAAASQPQNLPLGPDTSSPNQ